MSEKHTYRTQFEGALACQNKKQAEAWMAKEIAYYKERWGKNAVEARKTILTNLGYMAGYYDSATAHKIQELFGAVHPIFGSADYFETVSPEQAFEKGMEWGKRNQ